MECSSNGKTIFPALQAVNYIGWGDMGLCGLLVTQDKTYAVTNVMKSRE